MDNDNNDNGSTLDEMVKRKRNDATFADTPSATRPRIK